MPAASIAETKSDSDCCGMVTPVLCRATVQRPRPFCCTLDTGATAGARHPITDRLLPRLSTRPIVSHDLKAHHLAHPTWRLLIAPPRRRNHLEHRAKGRSAGQTENLCLARPEGADCHVNKRPACDAIEFSTGMRQPTEMSSCPPGFHAGRYLRLQEPL